MAQRKRPGLALRNQILLRQKYKCIYCDEKFNTYIKYKKKLRLLRICFDHLIPFAYLQNNPDDNWAAACQICNGIKSSKYFEYFEEIYVYVRSRRYGKASSYKRMRDLSPEVQNQERETKILFPKLQVAGMEQETPKDLMFPMIIYIRDKENEPYEKWELTETSIIKLKMLG